MTAEPIFTIDYLHTKQDGEKQAAFIVDRLFAQAKGLSLRARLTVILPSVAVLGLLLLDGAAKHWRGIAAVAVLDVILLTWRPILRAAAKRKNAKAVAIRQEAGELDLPTEVAFYSDRLVITNARTRSEFPWNEITNVIETADGLHLIHQKNRYLFLPARFFDAASALTTAEFLRQTAGAAYERQALMRAPDTAEAVEAVGQPDREEATPRYAFRFTMTGTDTAAVTGRTGRTMLRVIDLLAAVICALTVYRGMQTGNFLPAAVAAVCSVVSIIVLYTTFAKALQQNAGFLPDKDVTLQWYDDHVTAVTHREEEGVSFIPYRKLRAVSRLGKLTVIDCKDHTCLFVPHSAAQNAEELAEWERFLREMINKYSKL